MTLSVTSDAPLNAGRVCGDTSLHPFPLPSPSGLLLWSRLFPPSPPRPRPSETSSGALGLQNALSDVYLKLIACAGKTLGARDPALPPARADPDDGSAPIPPAKPPGRDSASDGPHLPRGTPRPGESRGARGQAWGRPGWWAPTPNAEHRRPIHLPPTLPSPALQTAKGTERSCASESPIVGRAKDGIEPGTLFGFKDKLREL